MMRSLYSGVSGLQNHQTRMDVVGNNLANVNTTGFKKNRVTFQDMLSQSQKGAARPNNQVGGVNPQQVGLGMQIASIDTIHTQGSMQTTGVKTDVAIMGNGFFVLRNGDTKLYSRAGAFGLDQEGMLVNPANGMRVQGWQAQTEGGTTFINSSASVGDLKIPVGQKDPAKATSEVFAACNLNKLTPTIPANATPEEIRNGTWSTTYDIYDSFGGPLELRMDYTRSLGADGQPIANQWRSRVTIIDRNGAEIVPQLAVGGTPNAAGDNNLIVQFDNFGTLESVSNAAGGRDADGTLATALSFLVPETAVPEGADAANPAFAAGAGGQLTQTLNLNIGGVGSFTNSSTQYAQESSNKIFRQDGYGMGYLEDFRIDQSGVITGVYSNGTNRALGQLALGSFTNPGGLEKAGDNNYAVSINSGDADIGPSGTAGKGKFLSGALEMSNVDLSETFTDMIVTQRGFQANSKTIQTSDQMLQELLQLKR